MTPRQCIAEVVRRDLDWLTDDECTDAILAALRDAGFAVVPVAEVAAQVAAARREGIEACIAEHAAAAIRLAGDPFMASYEECWARALRHKLLPRDAALARDFAAWTEGESDG